MKVFKFELKPVKALWQPTKSTKAGWRLTTVRGQLLELPTAKQAKHDKRVKKILTDSDRLKTLDIKLRSDDQAARLERIRKNLNNVNKRMSTIKALQKEDK